MDRDRAPTPDQLRGWEAQLAALERGRPRGLATRRNPDYQRQRPLRTRTMAIMALELKGYNKTEIAQRLGMNLGRVSVITNSDRYIAEREIRLDRMDNEFAAMKPAVFQAVFNGLRSRDENTALKASEAWMKAAGFGQYGKGPAGPSGVTAEDVAKQLLQVNVNVSIDKGE